MCSTYIIYSLLITCYSCLEIPIVSDAVNTVDGVAEDTLSTVEDLLEGGVPDTHRNPCQLIESRNFICDEQFIVTKDGYILVIHHVINPVLIAKGIPTIKPLVLQHGLFGSATHWLIGSDGGFAADWTDSMIDANLSIEGRNAPYLLSNLGYDVWIPNIRGCRYSRNHTYLNPDTDNDFWNFSYEQMITYDAPTIIDYVLNQTKRSKLGWIGHSQGTLIMFGLLAERPEYAAKLNLFIALAPVAHVGNINSPFRIFADTPGVKELLLTKGGEFNVPKSALDLFANLICTLPIANGLCENIFFSFGGSNPESFNKTRISAYITGGFCGTSVRNIVHYGHNIATHQFAKFDFGTSGNHEKYGSSSPPQYELGSITLENIVLMYSDNDYLADPTDVTTLKNELKVPYIDHHVESPKFSHLDFIWGIDVYEQVYEPMVRYLKKFE